MAYGASVTHGNLHTVETVFVYSYTDDMWINEQCACFLGPAVPPGYRPRFPDGGEGRLGESAQR